MQTLSINEAELCYLGMFRMVLSEASLEERPLAIQAVRHDVVGGRLGNLPSEDEAEWVGEPENTELVRWVAKTSAARHEAVHALASIQQRYEAKNERKLNVAEHIGKLVWLSIQDQKFQGIHVDGGILAQVRSVAKDLRIAGARDNDTLRKIWNCYRGVVHLGMAMDYCEDNPESGLNVLHLAEQYRTELSQNCPKGTSKPYVDLDEQICFVYISEVWGPRYRGRGLPFAIG